MKLKLTKKGISVPQFVLTADDIEIQAMEDLASYRKKYLSNYGKSPQELLDVDNFVKEMWGIEVAYEELPQSSEEEFLGRFRPDKQCITVDAKACKNPRRVSFTVAHEAGHLSLHSFLFDIVGGKVMGWKSSSSTPNKNLDRQADLYAASLLAPKQEIYNFLKEQGLSHNNYLPSPVDLSLHALAFQERFGLSRQALEIRLGRLKIPMANRTYSN